MGYIGPVLVVVREITQNVVQGRLCLLIRDQKGFRRQFVKLISGPILQVGMYRIVKSFMLILLISREILTKANNEFMGLRR